MTEDNDLGPTGTGAVVADIGDDRGGLVLYAPESMAGCEIDISRAQGGAKTHVAVRERRVAQGRLFAAFYPSVDAGTYVVWNFEAEAAGTVAIVGGELSELTIIMPAGAGNPRAFTISPHS